LESPFLAPRIFTLLTKKVKTKLGRLGIRTIFYLDDILVLGSSFHNCLANLQRALSILMEAGFLINWKKSCVVSWRSWTILGGVGESAPSQRGPSLSSRQDGSDPERTATKGLGGPSSLSLALPPFLSIRRL
jgi:hypothetical protein